MKLVWTSPALINLASIAAYIGKRDKAAATRVVTRIEKAVDLLRNYPAIGRQGRRAGTRELVIPSTSYIVIYTLSPEQIDITAVFHARQRRPGS